MKRFFTGLLAGAILASSVAIAATYVAEPATFRVMVNGKEFHSEPPALVVDGRTYLPLRALGEVLGVPVNWNSELNQAEVGNQAPMSEVNQYSRNNPAPLNTVQKYVSESDWSKNNNYTVAVRVMEFVRGEAALKALRAKSRFYPDPEDGYEYINVKIAFSVNDTKGEFSVEPSQYDFKSFSSKNVEAPTNYYSSIDPVIGGSLYAGGSTEGWITVMVKKDDKNPKIAYGLDYDGVGGIWFALYE